MPYIKEQNRLEIDSCIDRMIECLKENVIPTERNPYSDPYQNLTNEDLLGISGDINYTFSRILGGLMGQVSYGKIAIITGVLENIKQEFYRRVASSYEDKKIAENGDIKEYKRY